MVEEGYEDRSRPKPSDLSPSIFHPRRLDVNVNSEAKQQLSKYTIAISHTKDSHEVMQLIMDVPSCVICCGHSS